MTTNLNRTFAAVQAASRELALLNDDTINQILNAVADAAITLPILGMPDKIANFIGHYQIDISQKTPSVCQMASCPYSRTCPCSRPQRQCATLSVRLHSNKHPR